nr:type II toxin-antitoxin system Phd/YefM family antitoxin [uncultured Desulfobacter sp.]
MINISATNLRGNLFAILKKVESGEQVVVTHNKKPVAYLKPVKKGAWRDQVAQKPKLLVSPDDIIKPVEDVWEDYL